MKQTTLLALLVSLCAAQPVAVSVRGSVVGGAPGGSTIELYGSEPGPVQRTAVWGTGEFRLTAEPGQYRIALVGPSGEVLKEQLLILTNPGTTTVQFTLRERARPVSGIVSARQLAHKVPGSARRQFRNSAEAWRVGKQASAVEHLEKAIEIDPGFFEAHDSLGSYRMELGRYEAARQSFHRAVELDPSSARAQSNLAAALLALNELPQSEAAARRSLALDPLLATAEYLLGQSLVRQGRLTVDTLKHFRRAAREHPGARIWAANVLLALGDRAAAAVELRGYLQLGEERFRRQAEKTLARLRE